VAEGVLSSKAAQCLELPTTCSRGYYSVDSNLRSGTINGGRSEWQKNYPMMLLMSHPHWERKDGYSPLIIEYPVKEKDLGAELEVSIHSFSLPEGKVCPYEIRVTYRKRQSKEKQL